MQHVHGQTRTKNILKLSKVKVRQSSHCATGFQEGHLMKHENNNLLGARGG